LYPSSSGPLKKPTIRSRKTFFRPERIAMGGLNIIGLVAPLIAPPGPATNSTAKVPLPIVLRVETAIIDDPLVDRLKQLLPADSPVGTVLERFREAVASFQTQQPANDAA